MSDRFDVVIIGAGQAGLASSHELMKRGVGHVVLERGRVGQPWRGRWDTFCLVTPNWSMRLPGHAYDGANPDAFDPRDDIVAYLERYAVGFGAPVREGVSVQSLGTDRRGHFVLETSDGSMITERVVVSTGAYQQAYRPPAAAMLPADLPLLDVESYRNPDTLPPGRILVVGSGQSGCQIAEELHDAGRDVFLSCGRTPWAPRRVGDHDLFWWLLETGFLDAQARSLPSTAARLFANVVTSGHDGGHDLHLRTLRRKGVTLLGHFDGVTHQRARFADDLESSVAWGDDRYRAFRDLVLKLVAERGLPSPHLPDPEPFRSGAPTELSLDGFGAVIFGGGFRPDYASWIRVPGAFDEMGFPIQEDGASRVAPGLYFVGVHFLRTRKSSLFVGVGDDASVVADAIARRRSVARGPEGA
jgi:putative flavoprotein involved in K+ transport